MVEFCAVMLATSKERVDLEFVPIDTTKNVANAHYARRKQSIHHRRATGADYHGNAGSSGCS